MASSASSDATSVIVISSHVVRGSVGNRAAVFALESLGFPVWAVPTVVLPWHPGHGLAGRIVPPPQEFSMLLQDLERAPWLGEVGAILTGYLGHPEQVQAIAGLVKTVKARNPEAVYLCDPVIGDQKGLYVPEATAVGIRDRLLPLADISTPNRFELSWLTGVPLEDNKALMEAALDTGPATMLVTSAFPLMTGSIGNILLTPTLALMAEHRCVEGPTNGLGDLTAAVLLARKLLGFSEEKMLQSTTAAVFEVMARAAKRGADELMLEADAASLSSPMAMVQTRRLVHPTKGLRA
ncbi:pyridoxal kinase PdxY [Falsochrobactrum sp. TDYN1]|uniref:Pyridoxal kinase PdxY n=1 Tax=Falsochrobactrum tianjinense TaxID=2706015 RepID=A0A949UU60_9HYPH|nr:pyridoxal kinase PdxY [Falsochrobactrum sp. TDYN1]MBV2144824.1 pyridoxal kinase PdxY [Falsochrobactrum sp. TDYN1]